MFRLVFIGVVHIPEVGAPPTSAPRLIRRVRLSAQAHWTWLRPVRTPGGRRMLRMRVHEPLPMRSGWLKPAAEVLPGAEWSLWWSPGGIATLVWDTAG